MTSQAQSRAASSTRALHLLLAFANFAVGMGAFVVIGVLSPVASDFAVSKAEAGWLMTTYAIVYAVASPVLAATTGRMDRARVLVTGLVVLALGAALAALAPSYAVLLVARTLMAAGGALITPVAMAVGAASVEPPQRGKALATIYTGFTLAQVLGIPAGAWLGYAFGWRWAFGILAGFALIAAAVLYRQVPRGLAAAPNSLKILGSLLAAARPMWAVMFTVFFLSALFVLYTYIAPFLEARHGLGRTGVTAMLLVFGLAGVLGNAIGGFLTDRIGSVRTLAALCVAQIVLMPFLTLTYLPLIATGVAIALWSLSSWSVHVPQQARLAALDPQHAPVLLALHAGGLYVGGSVGSAIGGLALERWGVDALGPTGAVFAVLALASLAIVARLPGAARPG